MVRPRPEGRTALHRRPTRVLLEAPEGPHAAELWGWLAENGYEVSWCPGPEGPPASWCPLMGDSRCDLVESADVVVFALGLESATCREVLAKARTLHPEARIVVELDAGPSEGLPTLANGYQVLRTPVDAGSLCDAVELALGCGPDA